MATALRHAHAFTLLLALLAPAASAQEIAAGQRAALLQLLEALPAQPPPTTPPVTPPVTPSVTPPDDERLARTAVRFRELVNDTAARREALLPAYARHLDAPLATAWAAWWKSPATEHYREVLPEVQAEWQAATTAWMQDELAALLGSEARAAPARGARTPSATRARLKAAGTFVRATGQAAAGLAGVQALLQDLPGSPLGRQLEPGMVAAATTLAKTLAPGTPAEDRLVRLLAAPLAARLGTKELLALTAFWQTPAGRQLAALQPALARDVTAASTAFGVAAAKRAAREVLGPLPQWRPPTPR